MNVQGTQFPGTYMPNPGWQMLTQREQILQDQLQCERQQLEAWRIEVENKTLALQSQVSQPQVQAPPVVSCEIAINEIDLKDVEIRSDPRLLQQHPTDPSLPKGTMHEGLVLLPSPKRAEDKPVQAQDLAAFKSDMPTLIKDIIQSSLSSFASQFKSDSVDKGESFQDHETSRDKEHSPDPSEDPSEGKEGELASEGEDPELDQGDPYLDQLMLTEEEEKDFESFTLASLRVKRGTALWKVSQENLKFYFQARQAQRQPQAQVDIQAQAEPTQLPQAQAQAQPRPASNQAQ